MNQHLHHGENTDKTNERIAIVSGLRLPFAKQSTAYAGIPAVDLGKAVVAELLAPFETAGSYPSPAARGH